MARAVARARPATPDDIEAVLELFDDLLSVSRRMTRSAAAAGAVDPRVEAEQRYLAALDDVDARLLVAVVESEDPQADAPSEQLVGMTLCSVSGSGTFVDAPVVQMNHFFVSPSARRCGAGRALLAAATAWADERGLDGLGVAVPPSSREANRYFARLGFAPVYVHRVASLSALKRVLGSAVPAAAREESAHGARRRRRVGITGSRAIGRTRRYPV